jgi:hypothetical protein
MMIRRRVSTEYQVWDAKYMDSKARLFRAIVHRIFIRSFARIG